MNCLVLTFKFYILELDQFENTSVFFCVAFAKLEVVFTAALIGREIFALLIANESVVSSNSYLAKDSILYIIFYLTSRAGIFGLNVAHPYLL